MYNNACSDGDLFAPTCFAVICFYLGHFKSSKFKQKTEQHQASLPVEQGLREKPAYDLNHKIESALKKLSNFRQRNLIESVELGKVSSNFSQLLRLETGPLPNVSTNLLLQSLESQPCVMLVGQ